MPEVTLQLLRNPENGRLAIQVALRSEEDVLPGEHERDHKRLLSKLLPSLDLTFPPDGYHEVEREQIEAAPMIGCGGFDGGCGPGGGGYDDEYIEDHDPPV